MAWKQDYLAYIRSPEWELKRQQTFRLFGRRCFKCRSASNLHIHHKTYARFKQENVETDLIPLCKPCHKALHHFCKRRNLSVLEGSILFLNPPKMPKRFRSLIDIRRLMRQHDLTETDVRALIEVGAL